MDFSFETRQRRLLSIQPGQKVCYFSTESEKNGTRRTKDDLKLFKLARDLYEKGRVFLVQSKRFQQKNGAQAIDYLAIGRKKQKK